jgi:hypothetical protein
MCVYDPLTGNLTHLLSAPDIDRHSGRVPYTYVLLTAADGICLSFLLLAAEFNTWLTGSIKVQRRRRRRLGPRHIG